jgi:hypothetical protein
MNREYSELNEDGRSKGGENIILKLEAVILKKIIEQKYKKFNLSFYFQTPLRFVLQKIQKVLRNNNIILFCDSEKIFSTFC